MKKAKKLIEQAREKEDVRRKLVIVARELAVTAREKEKVIYKLELTAEKLAITAKEKEDTRRRLELIADELRLKAKQLAFSADQLALVAKEKEEARRKLAKIAKELRIKAKQLAVVAEEKEKARLKLAIIAKELRIKAKQLAVVAREKEAVRRKLVIVAKKLAVTAKQLATTAKKLAVVAKEKEVVRQKLAVIADELRLKAKQENKIQIKLKESEVRYRRLFETAHDGILILNSKTGQITDVNPFLEKLLGYSKNEFLNKKLWEVGPFKNTKASKDAFQILQKEGILRYEDLPLETKDGRSIEVEFVSNSYMAGETLVIQCNIRDITERKKIELIKETERLFEEEKLKVASIADATHELRTPIAIIKGNVDLALNSSTKNTRSPNSALRAIDSEVKHISGILSDLTLITSRGGELKNRIVFGDVNLNSVIKDVVSRAKVLAYKKNISINSAKIPNVIIYGDKEYLEKMIANLVKNTIIHGNQDGHTKIYTKKSPGFITINVSDDGIGISKEDLPHVFERFYRADKSHRSDGNSIGLGLSIVKWVAEAHGGKVSVKKMKGNGSVFSVTLPIKK
jgi:PAS domain S-box-containing protein